MDLMLMISSALLVEVCTQGLQAALPMKRDVPKYQNLVPMMTLSSTIITS